MAHDTREEHEATVLQPHAVIVQIMIFHVGRPIVSRRLNWQTFTPDRIDRITATLQASVLNSLGLQEPDRVA